MWQQVRIRCIGKSGRFGHNLIKINIWKIHHPMQCALAFYFILKLRFYVILLYYCKIGQVIDWKNYSEKLDFCFGIRYTDQIESDQPICFAYETNTFLRSNTVKHCQIMGTLNHLQSFLSHLYRFLSLFHSNK